MDPQGQSPSPLAALCQVHLGQPFTAVCQRCGTYMCAVCSEGGRHALCAPCRERAGVGEFPFDRNSYTLSALFDHAWKNYKQHWAMMTAGVVITFVTTFGVSFVASFIGAFLAVFLSDQPTTSVAVRAIASIPQVLVQGVCTLGLFLMALKVARGEKPELGDLFAPWHRVGAWLAQSLLIGVLAVPILLVAGLFAFLAAQGVSGTTLAIAGGGMFVLGMPVLFYALLGIGFANMELVAQPAVGAVEGIKNSWAIARGKRLELLLLGLSFVALYIAGAMACLIGVIFTMGYASVLYACFYLTVRNGTPELSS